jgi:hypothetical protein
MKFDLDTLLSSAGAMLKVPLFLGMFLIVRGVPALVLYRGSSVPAIEWRSHCCARPSSRSSSPSPRWPSRPAHALVDVGCARRRGHDLDAGVPARGAAVAAPGARAAAR